MSPAQTMEYIEAPDPALAQRMTALAEANRVRMHRAHLKREVAAGRKGLLDLMEHPDCASMTVVDALLALPRVGRVKAAKVLRRVGISSTRPLDRLTERERVALASHLYDWQARPPALDRAA